MFTHIDVSRSAHCAVNNLDVHDKCTRNHKRKRLRDLVQDVERHLQENGPWRYHLSQLYQTPEVTAAVEQMTLGAHAKIAA